VNFFYRTSSTAIVCKTSVYPALAQVSPVVISLHAKYEATPTLAISTSVGGSQLSDVTSSQSTLSTNLIDTYAVTSSTSASVRRSKPVTSRVSVVETQGQEQSTQDVLRISKKFISIFDGKDTNTWNYTTNNLVNVTTSVTSSILQRLTNGKTLTGAAAIKQLNLAVRPPNETKSGNITKRLANLLAQTSVVNRRGNVSKEPVKSGGGGPSGYESLPPGGSEGLTRSLGQKGAVVVTIDAAQMTVNGSSYVYMDDPTFVDIHPRLSFVRYAIPHKSPFLFFSNFRNLVSKYVSVYNFKICNSYRSMSTANCILSFALY